MTKLHSFESLGFILFCALSEADEGQRIPLTLLEVDAGSKTRINSTRGTRAIIW